MRGYLGDFSRRGFLLILSAMFLLSSVPVYAITGRPETRQRLYEISRQRQETREQTEEQRVLLEGTQYEMSQVSAEIQELDRQWSDAAETLEDIEYALLTTEIRIEEAEHDLDEARIHHDVQLETARARLRLMYEQGPMGWLPVLMDAEDISDFFTRWEYVRVAAQFDQEALNSLQEAEEQVSANVNRLYGDRLLIEDLQFSYENALRELENIKSERESFFDDLQEDETRFNEFISLLEEEERELDRQFGVYQARYDREVEEERERIRREEEAARERERQAELARQRAAQQAAAAAAAAANAGGGGVGSAGAASAPRAPQPVVRVGDAGGMFMWPVPSTGRISSGFGYRTHPISRRREFHRGIDIPAPTGTTIVAAADGVVHTAGWSNSFGNYIVIDHGNGYTTLYAHNSRNRVSVGASVTRGQHIGDIGSTGHSTGPHLHFEVRRNGSHINPSAFF